jgi:hypothetical protein
MNFLLAAFIGRYDIKSFTSANAIVLLDTILTWAVFNILAVFKSLRMPACHTIGYAHLITFIEVDNSRF